MGKEREEGEGGEEEERREKREEGGKGEEAERREKRGKERE